MTSNQFWLVGIFCL